jgi:general nucleoside transport system permease protein
MAEDIATTLGAPRRPGLAPARAWVRLAGAAEAVLIPAGALGVSLILFGIFVACAGVNPLTVYGYMVQGSAGSWFSVQNTLTRAAPLLLTALCTALPAQLGLMIIGGEGALVVGGLCAALAGVGLHGAPPVLVQLAMASAGIAAGGLWIALAGALRHWRGVNETISSLLLVYIAIAILNQLVEGVFRDPASLNKPSSPAIGDANMIGDIPGTEVHWGLAIGIVACILAYILIRRTTVGFAARIAGGNLRAARMVGLPVGKLVLLTCFLGGGAAGLAGMIEIAAVQERANSDLVGGYGYTGILVSFLARHNPLAIIPVAVLLGGISASGGLLQRHLGLPDAATVVLQGIIFIVILASDAVYGRLGWTKGAGR